MSITRPTQDYVNARRNAIQERRSWIDRANKLHMLHEASGWMELKTQLEYATKENREQLNQILDRKTSDVESDFANIKSLRAAELQTQRILDDVERGPEMIDVWLKQIKQYEEDIASVEKSGALK